MKWPDPAQMRQISSINAIEILLSKAPTLAACHASAQADDPAAYLPISLDFVRELGEKQLETEAPCYPHEVDFP